MIHVQGPALALSPETEVVRLAMYGGYPPAELWDNASPAAAAASGRGCASFVFSSVMGLFMATGGGVLSGVDP